jgi:hypothetical protein
MLRSQHEGREAVSRSVEEGGTMFLGNFSTPTRSRGVAKPEYQHQNHQPDTFFCEYVALAQFKFLRLGKYFYGTKRL